MKENIANYIHHHECLHQTCLDTMFIRLFLLLFLAVDRLWRVHKHTLDRMRRYNLRGLQNTREVKNRQDLWLNGQFTSGVILYALYTLNELSYIVIFLSDLKKLLYCILGKASFIQGSIH